MSASANWFAPARSSPLAATGRFSLSSDISAMALLRRVVGRMSKPAALEAVLGEVVDFAASVVKCDSCFIYVLQEDELVLRASKNAHPETVDRLKLKLGQGITGWVAEHREPAIISRNACADPRFKFFNELPEDRFEAFLSVPLVSRGRLVGVINIQNREAHRYSESEIGLLAMIGFLVGAEIEMARLEELNFQLTERLESRTIVERAKGILQTDLAISESEAYQRLQRQSQQMRKPMKEIAEAIVLSHAVTRGAEL